VPQLDQLAVWVADPHPIFRSGIVVSLRAEGVRVAGESAEVPRTLDDSGTKVLVFDAEAPGAAAAAAALRTVAALVALVRDARSDRVLDALAGGAAGVLVRADLTPLTLTACLRSVTSGHGAVPTEVLTRMLHAREHSRGADGSLAGREVDVLKLLAGGSTTRVIAGELCYSERTVKNIVRDLMIKLDCRTRAQAVATATREGII
jgi:DNA-binding NarL/FixJ family response regulator